MIGAVWILILAHQANPAAAFSKPADCAQLARAIDSHFPERNPQCVKVPLLQVRHVPR